MEDLKYLREAMDLISFMAGTEDSELDPQDVEILAQEIEATNSTGYDDYDDDHKVEQPADGINIMKLIETSIARYISNIKDANNGVNPHYLSNNVLNYNDKMDSYDKASAIIMSTFSKNKNDVEQQLDTEILKEYNKITMLIKNKAKMKKLMGTKNDPFLFEGIMVTYDLMTRLLLAYVPMKIQSGETLASILNKKSGMVFMKIFDVVKYINSIQNKLGTKIYYKPPLVSEITGKKIDTVKDTKFDFRRNDQDREDSGFRDYNREVIVTAGRESEDIDYNDFEFEESMEGVFSWIKDKFKAERDRLANIKYRSQSIEITSKTQEKIILELQKINKLIYDKALKLFKQKYTAQNIEDFGLELWDPKTDTQCVHRAGKWGSHIGVDTIQWSTYNARYKNKDWYDPMYDDLSNIAKTGIPKSINVDGKEIEILADVGSEYIMIETVKECKINDNLTEGTEGVLDSIKHYLWDTPKEAVLSTYSGIKFTKEDYEFLNKTLPSIMRDYVRQVNKSPLLKENGVKAELPDTMPIDVYKSWVSQPKLSRTMWIPIAKFTGLTSFKLKFKSLTAGGSWKMALERIPDRWKSRGSKLQEVSGGHLLLIESPGFRTKEVSVESFNFNPEMFYDSEDFIKNYHLSCESIENLIEIRNNNSLLEYSKLIKGLAFTTTLFKPLTGYDVEELTKDIDKLLKDPSVNVVNMITALIAKIDVKVITPINIEFKRYTNNEEGKSLLSEQFAPKEFDSSIQGRMYQASRPKVEDFEEF